MRRSPKLANITSHCFSEPCPNLAGSYLVDYDGRTLLNYDFLKQALAPISMSLALKTLCLIPPAAFERSSFW